MVTFSKMGNLGRLGNQMFQYAALASTATRNGFEFGIPQRQMDLQMFPNLSSRFVRDLPPIEHEFHEDVTKYDARLNGIKDHTDISGFFQCPLYFKEYKSMIEAEFEFPAIVKNQSRRIIDAVPGPTAAVHVRGGDYLDKRDYHPPCGTRYYQDAMSYMRGDGIKNFIVFTDDPGWAQSQIPVTDDVRFVNNGALPDLCMMSMCDAHIIANSSYSWWGAFLADSLSVIAPDRWYGDTGLARWQHIYCGHWRIFSC